MLYAVHEQDILVTVHVAELEHLDSLVGKTSYEASAALLAGVLLRLKLDDVGDLDGIHLIIVGKYRYPVKILTLNRESVVLRDLLYVLLVYICIYDLDVIESIKKYSHICSHNLSLLHNNSSIVMDLCSSRYSILGLDLKHVIYHLLLHGIPGLHEPCILLDELLCVCQLFLESIDLQTYELLKSHGKYRIRLFLCETQELCI